MTNELQLLSKRLYGIPALGRFSLSFLIFSAISFASLTLILKSLGYPMSFLNPVNVTGYSLLLALVPRLVIELCFLVGCIKEKEVRQTVYCLIAPILLFGFFVLTIILANLMHGQFPWSFRLGVSLPFLVLAIAYELNLSLQFRQQRSQLTSKATIAPSPKAD